MRPESLQFGRRDSEDESEWISKEDAGQVVRVRRPDGTAAAPPSPSFVFWFFIVFFLQATLVALRPSIERPSTDERIK